MLNSLKRLNVPLRSSESLIKALPRRYFLTFPFPTAAVAYQPAKFKSASRTQAQFATVLRLLWPPLEDLVLAMGRYPKLCLFVQRQQQPPGESDRHHEWMFGWEKPPFTREGTPLGT